MRNDLHIRDMMGKLILTLFSFFICALSSAQVKEDQLIYQTESDMIVDFCLYEGGEKLAVADNCNVKIFSTRTGQLLDEVITGFNDRVLVVDHPEDGDLIACGGVDGALIVYDMKSRDVQFSIPPGGKAITAVKLSQDQQFVLWGRSDGCVTLYDIRNQKNVYVWNDHLKDITSVQFSPDGNLIATTGGDTYIRLYSVENGKLVATLAGHKSWVRRLLFNGNDELFSSGDDSRILKWNLSDYQNITFKINRFSRMDILTGLDYIPALQAFAVSSLNGRLTIVSPGVSYIARLKGAIMKIGFIPYEKEFLKLVVASNGEGVRVIEAADMKFQETRD